MREDFRCRECGHNFGIKFEGKSSEIVCPKCNQRWKIEESRFGVFRVYRWV